MLNKTAHFPLKIILLVLFCVQLLVLVTWIDYPLLDHHAFRQTQTVLSAYWLLQDFNPLNYITPVLGAPWSIPFEFPLYQLFVVLLAKIFPFLGFDAAARIVSWSFSIACAYPLFRIVRRYADSETTGLTAVCFYLACPLYLFWGRTGMIESTALFFSCMCFWQLIRLGDSPSWRFTLLAALFGVCGALAKITTIPVFMAAGYAHILCVQKSKSVFSRDAVFFLLPGAISLLAAYAWYTHADQVKMLNDFGRQITSEKLIRFNFGTLEQRLSAKTWSTLLEHAFRDILSIGAIPLVCAVVAFFRVTPRRNKLFALAGVAVFMLPLLIFTNLHYVHDYYQAACAIALLASFAFLISPDESGKSPSRHAVAVACISLFLVFGFFLDYYPDIKKAVHSETLVAADIVKQHTRAESAIIVYGWGWSSEVPYYSRRKGLAVPEWDNTGNAMDAAKHGMGGLPVSALVVRNLTDLPRRDQDEIAAILRAKPAALKYHERNVDVYILEPEGALD